MRRKERDDLVEKQCESLTESSGGTIRAHVQRHHDAGDFVASLKQAPQWVARSRRQNRERRGRDH